MPRRPRIPRPDLEPDAEDVLNNRLNRLRYGPIKQSKDEKILARRLAEWQQENANIPKGVVKNGKSNVVFFQPVLPDTPPPLPDYFPPLPLGLSDMNFLKPNLPPKPDSFLKPNLPPKSTFDSFARPLT